MTDYGISQAGSWQRLVSARRPAIKRDEPFCVASSTETEPFLLSDNEPSDAQLTWDVYV